MPSRAPDALLADLIAAEQRGERLKLLMFWGHEPSRPDAIGAHVLSQWAPSSFTVGEQAYHSAEQYMMAEKAALFGDRQARDRILSCTHPAQAKAIGREVRGFTDQCWDAHRFEIVVTASVAKFSQNPSLYTYLIGTGRRILVETSPRDRIWGIGLPRDHPDAERPSRWPGKNLLGFALMTARSIIAGT